jgi:hypothetical protein
VHEPLRAEVAHRLEAEADLDPDFPRRGADGLELRLPGAGLLDRAEPDLGETLGKFPRENLEQPGRLGRAGGEFNARVNVLGVLPEDHHVDEFGVLHRRLHALEVAHGPQAHEEVEFLPQGDIERTDPTADRRGQRALDADAVFAERLQGVLRQPRLELAECFLPGIDLEPGDPAAALVGPVHRGVEDPNGGPPDVRPGAVALDKRQHRVVGDLQPAAGESDFAARGRSDVRIGHFGIGVKTEVGDGTGANRQPPRGESGARAEPPADERTAPTRAPVRC